MPEGINHLRLGASIVLAESPTPPGLYELLNNDAFTLTADIIEPRSSRRGRMESQAKTHSADAPSSTTRTSRADA